MIYTVLVQELNGELASALFCSLNNDHQGETFRTRNTRQIRNAGGGKS